MPSCPDWNLGQLLRHLGGGASLGRGGRTDPGDAAPARRGRPRRLRL
ncbi:MAG TPA: hypothetical protein VF734_01260 [Pseudonocardiaceae bacterium]